MNTIGTQVQAHTGSTKNGTYRIATGTITGYEQKTLGPSHYVLMYVVTEADGTEHRVAASRLI